MGADWNAGSLADVALAFRLGFMMTGSEGGHETLQAGKRKKWFKTHVLHDEKEGKAYMTHADRVKNAQ